MVTQCTSTVLVGLEQIAQYLGVSIPRVRELIRDEGLPALQEGTRWYSDTVLIDVWLRSRIERATAERLMADQAFPRRHVNGNV